MYSVSKENKYKGKTNKKNGADGNREASIKMLVQKVKNSRLIFFIFGKWKAKG